MRLVPLQDYCRPGVELPQFSHPSPSLHAVDFNEVNAGVGRGQRAGAGPCFTPRTLLLLDQLS